MNANEINEIKYSLCKRLNCDDAPMQIHTNYGELPLTREDIIAVRKLLRKRFEIRLKKLNS